MTRKVKTVPVIEVVEATVIALSNHETLHDYHDGFSVAVARNGSQEVRVDVAVFAPTCFHHRKQHCYGRNQRANALKSGHKTDCHPLIAFSLLPGFSRSCYALASTVLLSQHVGIRKTFLKAAIMSKHRRFSWEDSTTRIDLAATDNDRRQASFEQLDDPGRGPEQSTERNTEQSHEQSIALTANDTYADNTHEASFQSREEATATTIPSFEMSMFVHPPTPTGSVRRTNHQASPLTHESYKRDGWVIPDGSVHPCGMDSPDTSCEESSGSTSVGLGRKSRFDSAAEKNNEDVVHSADTLETRPDVSPHTWPGARLRQNDRTPLRALNDITNTSAASPSNNLELPKGAPLVPLKGSNPASLPATWYCCMCDDTHGVQLQAEGPHPIGQLGSECSHRPCQDCEFSGYIKMYCPVDEQPALVHMSGEKDDKIKFGVICHGCGLSWRAQPVKTDMSRMRSVLHKISVLPKKLNRTHSLQKLRQASASMINLSRPTTSLSKTRSFANLRSVSETKKKGEGLTKEVGGQAHSARVRFFGIACACGRMTGAESVCFQITDVPWGTPEADLERKKVEIRQRVGSASPPELQAKGHRDRVIHLKGGEHPNPLLSSPVDEFRRQTLYMGGQQLPGELSGDWNAGDDGSTLQEG
jgi:hypothetical protein